MSLKYTDGPASVVHRPSVRPQCSNIFSETAWPIEAKFYVEPPWVGETKFCLRHLGHIGDSSLQPIIVCSNDDPRLTLTYFTARSNLVTYAFLYKKVKTVDFSETIAASDLKVGRSRHLNEFMKVSEY